MENTQRLTNEDVAKVVAANLVAFRKHAGLTQLELAERLQYSDKSISKWERGDGLPDVVTLKELANLYGTTVDTLLNPNAKVERGSKLARLDTLKKRIIISVLVAAFVWFLAVALFTGIVIFTERSSDFWLIFVYAIPATCVVLYLFHVIWGNKFFNIIIMSVFAWSLSLALFLTIDKTYMWLIFVLAAAFQVVLIVWIFYVKERLKKKKLNDAMHTK